VLWGRAVQEREESYRLYSCRGCSVSVSICGPCDHGNIFCPGGLGKTMLMKNMLYRAVLHGHTARFTLASDMLHDLAAQDSSASLARRLRRYTSPGVLAVDEVGYLSYDARYADLFFEVITRRYQNCPVIISTNKPFGEWSQVFPNAGCVVTLVDRLMHKAEILTLAGKSYRLKEAQERAARNAKSRAEKKAKKA
jgi:DNA replication protein DnaC